MTTKTDRELLELAAKACELDVVGYRASYLRIKRPMTKRDGWEFGGEYGWNPIKEDGDAFRLAVQLSLEIDIGKAGVAVRTPNGEKILVDSDEIKCGYRATRLAIVRAAAAIGESQP